MTRVTAIDANDLCPPWPTLRSVPMESLTPPQAARRPITTEIHGDQRIDDFEWLRAKEDPEVLAYLEAGKCLYGGSHRSPGPASG